MSREEAERVAAKILRLPEHERAAFEAVVHQMASDVHAGQETIATEDIGPTVLGLIELYKAIDERPSEPR